MHRIGVSASAENKSYVPKAGMQICSKLSRFQEDVSKTGQTPAADLTHPVSRLKIQPRNYDADGTNPEMR